MYNASAEFDGAHAVCPLKALPDNSSKSSYRQLQLTNRRIATCQRQRSFKMSASGLHNSSCTLSYRLFSPISHLWLPCTSQKISSDRSPVSSSRAQRPVRCSIQPRTSSWNASRLSSAGSRLSFRMASHRLALADCHTTGLHTGL